MQRSFQLTQADQSNQNVLDLYQNVDNISSSHDYTLMKIHDVYQASKRVGNSEETDKQLLLETEKKQIQVMQDNLRDLQGKETLLSRDIEKVSEMTALLSTLYSRREQIEERRAQQLQNREKEIAELYENSYSGEVHENQAPRADNYSRLTIHSSESFFLSWFDDQAVRAEYLRSLSFSEKSILSEKGLCFLLQLLKEHPDIRIAICRLSITESTLFDLLPQLLQYSVTVGECEVTRLLDQKITWGEMAADRLPQKWIFRGRHTVAELYEVITKGANGANQIFVEQMEEEEGIDALLSTPCLFVQGLVVKSAAFLTFLAEMLDKSKRPKKLFFHRADFLENALLNRFLPKFSLTALSFIDCPCLKKGVISIINRSKTLAELEVGNTERDDAHFWDGELQLLCKPIKNRLSALSLTRVVLSDKTVSGFRACLKLHTIHLDHVVCSSSALVDAIFSRPHSPLKKLALTFCSLEPAPFFELISNQQAIANLQSLHTLDLSGSDALGADCAIFLFMLSPSLHTFSLRYWNWTKMNSFVLAALSKKQNQDPPFDCHSLVQYDESIAQSLSMWTGIASSSLDIESHSPLRNLFFDGSKTLPIEMIQHFSQLSEQLHLLSLSDCHLSTEEINDCFEFLLSNHYHLHLHLRGNGPLDPDLIERERELLVSSEQGKRWIACDLLPSLPAVELLSAFLPTTLQIDGEEELSQLLQANTLFYNSVSSLIIDLPPLSAQQTEQLLAFLSRYPFITSLSMPQYSKETFTDIEALLLDHHPDLCHYSLQSAIRQGYSHIMQILSKRAESTQEQNEKGQTSLILATKAGHLSVLQSLINSGANIEAVDNKGRTGVMHAAKRGHIALLRCLIDAGADPGKKDRQGWSALMHAANSGHLAIVQLLAANGVDINEKDQEGFSPLIKAIVESLPALFRTLILAGADLHQKDRQNRPALVLAYHQGNIQMAKELIAAKVNLDDADQEGRTLLMHAAMHDDGDTLSLLIEKNALLDAKDHQGWSALMHAANSGHLAIVQLLAANGVDINEKDRDGFSPLMKAVIESLPTLFDTLISAGADLYQKDCQGQTCLMHAAKRGRCSFVQSLLAEQTLHEKDDAGQNSLMLSAKEGHLDVVKSLIAAGANTNEKDHQGKTALMLAYELGKRETVQFLTEHRAGGVSRAIQFKGLPIIDKSSSKEEISQKNDLDQTALMQAAYNGDMEMMEWLIQQHQFDIAEKDKEGCTCLMYAVMGGHFHIIQKLIQLGANLSEKSNDGYTNLMHAAIHGRTELVQCLIAYHQFDIHEKDNQGNTALMLAVSNGHLHTARELVVLGADIFEKRNDGTTNLIFAAMHGRTELVQWLIQAHQLNIDEKNNRENTALMAAIAHGELQAAQKLIALGANIDEKGHDNCTVLMQAAYNGHIEIMEWLLQQYQFDIHDKDNCDRNCLAYAAWGGHFHIIQKLISLGADIHEKNKNGLTCVMFAIEGGSLDTVQKLIELGANVGEKTGSCLSSSLQHAVSNRHLHLVKQLAARGIDFPKESLDALLNAVYNNDLPSIKTRIENEISSKAHQGALHSVYTEGRNVWGMRRSGWKTIVDEAKKATLLAKYRAEFAPLIQFLEESISGGQ